MRTCPTHTSASHIKAQATPIVACRSGCWWQWDLTDADQTSHWSLLVQGAAPCTGFQVMQSSNSSAHTTDITHMAVQLPDVSKPSLKQKMHRSFTGAADTEGHQTWLVRVRALGVVMLWLDGNGASKAVEATVEVRLVFQDILTGAYEACDSIMCTTLVFFAAAFLGTIRHFCLFWISVAVFHPSMSLRLLLSQT